MSKPKRYEPGCEPESADLVYMEEHAQGDYIRYEDYARLKEDAERYRLASLRGDVAVSENARLKAEVERLRRVMDVAAPMLFDAYMKLADAYAAKEGKQP